MSTSWRDLRRNVSDLYAAAAAAAGKLARRGALSLDLVGLRRSLAREYEALGRRAREIFETAPESAGALPADGVVRDILARTAALEADIARTEEHIASLRQEDSQRKTEPASPSASTSRGDPASNAT